MRTRGEFVGVPQFGQAVLVGVIRQQPLSPGKVKLAWQLAAGPQLARVAEAELHADGRVRLRTWDARWAAEIDRSRAMLLARLRELLDLPSLELLTECSSRSLPAPPSPSG